MIHVCITCNKTKTLCVGHPPFGGHHEVFILHRPTFGVPEANTPNMYAFLALDPGFSDPSFVFSCKPSALQPFVVTEVKCLATTTMTHLTCSMLYPHLLQRLWHFPRPLQKISCPTCLSPPVQRQPFGGVLLPQTTSMSISKHLRVVPPPLSFSHRKS